MRFIPYSHQSIDSNDIKEIVKVLKSDWLTQGPRIKEFEESFCQYFGVKYAVAVSSGTAALHIAVIAAGIKNGDEVITSPITFVASSNCVLYCGGRPVFVDIEEDTLNINPCKIIERITEKTKVLIPVDFAGHPCDLDSIFTIAKKNNLIVIEDAAHAIGAQYKEKKIGSLSDMTIFSFHPAKHITTGEGGMVLTNNKKFYERLLLYRTHGIIKDSTQLKKNDGPWYYEMKALGYNYRITDIQCSLGISQLKRLESFVEKRREIADTYNRSFKDIGEIILPSGKKYCKNSYHLYVIRMKDKSRRKEVFDRLRELGIGVNVHYIPVHLQPYYREKFGYKKGDFPIAEDYYQRAISLPIFPKMNKNDIKKVINAVKSIFKK